MTDLDEFLAKYNPAGHRTVTEVSAERSPEGYSPFVVIRHGRFAVVLDLLAFSDHLCVDVHSFVDEEKATAAAFGMTTGRRHQLPVTGTTSHDWPSTATVAVLIGEQGVEEPAKISADGTHSVVLKANPAS